VLAGGLEVLGELARFATITRHDPDVAAQVDRELTVTGNIHRYVGTSIDCGLCNGQRTEANAAGQNN